MYIAGVFLCLFAFLLFFLGGAFFFSGDGKGLIIGIFIWIIDLFLFSIVVDIAGGHVPGLLQILVH